MRLDTLRIGFVALIDAAPIIAAQEMGYFREESFSVSLQRQIGWGNLRDKLTFGQLDAGQALLGMPLASQLGREWFAEPLVALMGLGGGGNAITIRKNLHDAGVTSANELAKAIRDRPGKLMIGHVFASSMHHYLLREWLSMGGIDPDKDVKLCVIPPPQMPSHMKNGYVDVFCAGEPWNTLAMEEGHGSVIAATTDILPAHPEKVLAVSERFAGINQGILSGLVRAVLRGCMWCHDAKNREALASMLARPEYMNLPVEFIRKSLLLGREMGTNKHQRNARPTQWNLRTFSSEATFPNKMHTVWMMREMIRWGHLHPETDVLTIAGRCVDTAPYRAAAEELKIECPAEDFAPMALRRGQMLRVEHFKERVDVRDGETVSTKKKQSAAKPATIHHGVNS